MSSNEVSIASSTTGDTTPPPKVIPYITLTNFVATEPISVSGISTSSSGLDDSSCEPVRVIMPLFAGRNCSFIANCLQGLTCLPGCEAALLGKAREATGESGAAATAGTTTATTTTATDYAHTQQRELTDLTRTDFFRLTFPPETPADTRSGIRYQWSKRAETVASAAYASYVEMSRYNRDGEKGTSARAYTRTPETPVRHPSVSSYSSDGGGTERGEPARGVEDAAAREEEDWQIASSEVMDSAAAMEVRLGQTAPYNTDYVPVALPGSTSETHKLEEDNEDLYHCLASNSVNNMPLFPFPQVASVALTELAYYMVRTTTSQPWQTAGSGVGVCDALGPAADMVNCTEQQKTAQYAAAMEIMAAAAFLQV